MYKIDCASTIYRDIWYVVGKNGVNICQCNSRYAATKIAKALNKQIKIQRRTKNG